MIRRNRIGGLVLALVLAAGPGHTQSRSFAWSDPRMAPDVRADLVIARMTLDEKISLVHGHFPRRMKPLPSDIAPSGGYFPGVPRLGIPALRETDASLGVAENGPGNNAATALPSGMALASTWNSAIAEAGGAMIGKQTRQRGFNILLAGGVNLTRDAYNGRNFEYLGEDPLLAGRLAGASIRGIQSRQVASTVKHYVLNAQETGRHVVDARIGEAALRESDLLAFQFAIEDGSPAAVMCSYNKVNGEQACENRHLLTDVLRTDWGFRGWVMSDWGALRSVGAATAGTDQESGQEEDREVYFDGPLRAALASGRVSRARLDEMVRRIVRGMFAAGLMDPAPPLGPLDVQRDNEVALKAAEAGIVVLKNDRDILPLAASAGRIAVIGGHADIGVLSGGGSSQVVPDGSVRMPPPADVAQWVKGPYYHPSAALDAIRRRARGTVSYSPGTDLARAVEAARKAEVAIVFAEQWALESHDTTIRLSDAQEALIAAVAAANPRTIVVLETGGPVIMPWRDRVPGLIEAWYSGGQGGEAIARILFGEVDPSGRLPVTFAASADQLPRASPPGLDLNPPMQKRRPWEGKPFAIDYREGSSLGYRWFAQHGYKPAYPFGYGLSYTRFDYAKLAVTDIKTLRFAVTVTNTGKRAGRETAQLYLRKGPQRSQQRLLGWAQVDLAPGESRAVEIAVDPRLLANWNTRANRWRIDGGRYRIFAGRNATNAALEVTVTLAARSIGAAARHDRATIAPMPIAAAAQAATMKRGVNILGYDPVWDDPARARFQPRLMQIIRDGGFSTVRINLRAFDHMDADNRLGDRWFATLDRFVAAALAAKLTVILDEHDHNPCNQDPVTCRPRLMAFWRQVAVHFKDAPAGVLFEILNEPTRAMNDHWNAYLAEALAIIRQSNPTRNVVIGPTSANNRSALDTLILPEDDRHIIVTFHYYEPLEFTHQGAPWSPHRVRSGVTWGTDADRATMAAAFDGVKAWARAHRRPMLLGEFGAYDRGDLPSRVAYTRAAAREAEAHGWPWAYWQLDGDFTVYDIAQGRWNAPIHAALVPGRNGRP